MTNTPRFITAAEAEGIPITNPITGQSYTRFGPFVDLGMVSLRDAAIYGRTRPIIPYADGRLISGVRFVPGGTPIGELAFEYYFTTPNLSVGTGFACATDNYDTLGIIPFGQSTSIGGGKGDNSQIVDTGPLISGLYLANYFPLGTWEANQPYANGDALLDSNGFVQLAPANGVSGEIEPTWAGLGESTPDGTIGNGGWSNVGELLDQTVHAIVEVIEGVSPMPPYPATLEFIAPPADSVAGEAMADITVMLKDQYGNPYLFLNSGSAPKVYLRLTGDGTFSGSGENGVVYADRDDTTGIATINGLIIDDPGTYVLRADLGPLSIACDPISSDPFDVTAP